MTASLPALDLITTPVAVLNGTGLRTAAGLSADDPLSTRHVGERYRAFVSYYAPDGSFADRCEVPPLAAHERRLIDLSGPAAERFGAADCLAVVHRVPERLCPPGADPEHVMVAGSAHADYAMYRAMAQYGLAGGGHGGVIYETPPHLNDTRDGRRRSTTLTFSSKIVVSPTVDTVLLLLHLSADPAYRHTATYRFRLHRPDGTPLAESETRVPAFTPRALSMRAMLSADGRARAGLSADGLQCLSLVGWTADAALLTLFVHTDTLTRSVAIEHAHPPQTYLLPADNALRARLKSRAVERWDAAFGRLGP
jgi:hypothetical protein